MLSILLMFTGALLIIVAVIGLIAYGLAPFYKNIRVVLYGEDDYLHFISPKNYAYLQNERRKYLRHVAVVGISGLLLFGSGCFMRFGSRGLQVLLGFSSESPEDSPLAAVEEINQYGDFTDASSNKTYKNYFVVRGNEIFYRTKAIGGIESFSEYLDENAAKLGGRLCLVDCYAASGTYTDVMKLLDEKGYSYELASA